ncbi:Uncharacterised protein [Vibrio cholerae]|nr:Uncharacterised protein [Vibrio cholerae]
MQSKMHLSASYDFSHFVMLCLKHPPKQTPLLHLTYLGYAHPANCVLHQ